MAKLSTGRNNTALKGSWCLPIHPLSPVIGHPRAARSNYPSINTDSRSVSATPIRSSLFLLLSCDQQNGWPPLFPRASIHIRSSFVDRANRLLSSFAQIVHVSQLYAPLHGGRLYAFYYNAAASYGLYGVLSRTANVTSSRAGRSTTIATAINILVFGVLLKGLPLNVSSYRLTGMNFYVKYASGVMSKCIDNK